MVNELIITKPHDNQLFQISTTQFKDEEINSVDARELHQYLESKQMFAHWIKNKVVNNPFFIEGFDYILLDNSIKQGQHGGHNRKDYALSISTAKKVSMAEQTEEGDKARDYFLKCEESLKEIIKASPQLPDFKNPAEAARAWASEFEAKTIAETKLIEQAPKVQFAETIEGSEDCVTIGEYAKLNGNIGRNKLFAMLRDHKVLMSNNTPYQKHINQGYFEVTEKTTSAGLKPVTLVTGKGQLYLDKKLRKWI